MPRPRPHYPVIRQENIAEEVDALSVCPYRHFAGMEVEEEFLLEKRADRVDEIFQFLTAFCDDGEVVGVTGIVRYFQLVLDELIEFVEVDVREELRGEITDRHSRRTHWGETIGSKTSDNLF